MTEPQSIHTVVIVIPARNEQDLLPRCLHVLTAAIADLVQAADPAPPIVKVAIVLDDCTDETDTVARHWPQFFRIHTTQANVGAARRAGVRHLLPNAAHYAPATWIATTDADSTVPRNWLTPHLTFARNNIDLVLGTVHPDAVLSTPARQHWHDRHLLVDGHPHIHGANLGVRADQYLAAGEFEQIKQHEDVHLVSALRELHVTEMRTARIPVLTSGRLADRAPSGFADYLRAHAETLPTSTHAAAGAAHPPG